nr:MAG TPA: hypothetical protein [Caudoviricetes sp.]
MGFITISILSKHNKKAYNKHLLGFAMLSIINQFNQSINHLIKLININYYFI